MSSSKKKIIVGIVIAAVAAAAICGWYFGIKVPHDNALAAYSDAVAEYNTKIGPYNQSLEDYNNAAQKVALANKELDGYISKAQDAVNSGGKPYDSSKLDGLSTAISDARKAEQTAPEQQKAAEQLSVTAEDSRLSANKLNEKAASLAEEGGKVEKKQTSLAESTAAIKTPDYSSTIKDLQGKQKAYEDSVKILKQVTCPAESFVIARLQELKDVKEIAAVTEDHDPNGLLNKAKGYTSTVYFSLSQVDQSNVFGSDIIDKGTDAGGAVETYANVEDAENRSDYLGALDGTVLSSGSHMVLGTMVVRVSDELTASQQKKMQDKIVAALTDLR